MNDPSGHVGGTALISGGEQRAVTASGSVLSVWVRRYMAPELSVAWRGAGRAAERDVQYASLPQPTSSGNTR